jgi:isoquinoline 1-oxidoreductase
MTPWDHLAPEERDLFERFGDGLVVVVPPQPAGPRALPHGGAWIHVGPDGTVSAFTGKVEVGQGTRTALALLVAEELRVPLSAVRMMMGDTDLVPWDMGTFGSLSMPVAGQHLRLAAARARELQAEAGPRRRVEIIRGPVALTPADAWSTAGRPTRDPDATDAVTGARRFATDLRRPGMLHGKVLHPPAQGASLRAADIRRAEALAGVTVVRDGSFVAVAASDRRGAEAALAAIDARWDLAPQPSEDAVAAHLRAHPTEGEGFWGATHHEVGAVDAALAGAPVTGAASYTTAYIAHVPLEPRCALAEWSGGRLTVATGTQTPFAVRADLAEALGVAEDDVRVLVPPTGGAFGGKHVGDVALAAARLARASGRPVRVAFDRQEELANAYFRPMAVIDVRAGAGADGTLHAWAFKNTNSGSHAISTPYRCPNQRIDHQPADSPLAQGSYRALAATANCFARESHMDELAARFGIDPLEYRLRHLDDDRLATVLRAAAERAGWPGRNLGLACGIEKGGRIATVAAVRGERVERIVSAFECGAIVHPDNLRNQIEGATVMAIGGALFEAVRFDAGRVTSDRLSRYRVPRFNDVPPIEVVLVDRRDQPPAGAGETPLIAVAPAIANAICAATGRRLRSLPLLG